MSFNYKTLYIPTAEVKPKSAFSGMIPEANGDELARDIEAALVEMEAAGYKLHTMTPVTSSKMYMSAYVYGYTEGVLLVFEKLNVSIP